MSDEYIRDLLRVAVAQICQTIGYNATQAAPLELLQDTVHKFLNEFTRNMRQEVEHYNRTEANLNDACLTLSSVNINVNELLDYINNVEPVPFIVDVPKFPVHKDSNLNFLKPGSKEVLTRPVHMYEHLPPILPVEPNVLPLIGGSHYMLNGSPQGKTCLSGFVFDADGGEVIVSNTVDVNGMTAASNPNSDKEYIALAPPFAKTSSSNTHLLDEEGRPTREISSVVMTTGGFISPAIEGKLPDAIIPDLIAKFQGFDTPPTPPPPPSRPEINKLVENEITTTAHATTESDNESFISKTLKNIDSKKSSNPAEISSTSGSGTISTSTSSFDNVEVTSSAGNLTGKKTIPFQYSAIHTQHSPTVASKLLKKAKKNTSTSCPFPLLGKFNRSDFPGYIGGGINHSNMYYDKAQRKSIKMLQKKKSKSIKAAGAIGDATIELDRSDGMFKELINHTELATMSPSLDFLQIEKLMKKQARQKQRQKKNQLKNLVDNQQSAIPSAENMLSNKIFTSLTSSGLVRDIKISQASKDIVNQCFSMAASKSTSHVGASNRRNLLDPMQSIRGVKSSAANIFTNIQPVTDLIEGSLNTADSNEKRTPFDVKLSTEPDRSKLNIFKKISKQKGKVSPNTSKMQTTPVYTISENKIINLPSGTTITPAPPSIVGSRHVYPPDVSDIVPVDTLSEKIANKSMGLSAKQGSHLMSSVQSNISVFGTAGEHIGENALFINKPKKRGRKPGSKNHVKVAVNIGSTNISPIKKAKKIKIGKTMYGMYGTNFPPVSSELNTEPLNLTSSNQFGSKFAMNFQRPFPAMGQAIMHTQSEIKEKKDRKKIKTKNPPVATVTSSSEQTNCVKPNVNVPTKEEVHSINKKLMRMDTVLKPAPASPSPLLLISADCSKNVSDSSKIISPTKSAASSDYKKHSQQRSNITQPVMPPLFSQPTTRSLFPMMPLYVYQSRPGLIPTPGLFPTAAPGLFPTNPKNVAPTMLMPSFLNFPPRVSATGLNDGLDGNNDENNEATPQAGDRSYCNVASFVPESMKLTPPQPKADRQTSDCESYPLTPKLRRSPTLSEVVSDTFCKQLDNYSTPDSSSVNSKSIPTTPGVISLSNFEVASTRENSSLQITENTHSFKNNMFVPNTLSKSNIGKNVQQTQSAVNADDPIEVSDDSLDTPSKPLSPLLHTTKSKVNQSFMKPSPTSVSVSNIEDIFTPIRDMRTMGNESTSRESKKLKKSNKFAKKNIFPSPTMLPIDIFGAEKGGKLAGGADLIPLPTTGLAYSSKTIPSTSLTASATPRFPIHKSEFILFSNLTHTSNILPAADLQKKHKEHKKIKKLKDGKIKKKKDKKDKSKSRERNEKYSHKTEKLNKETEKDLLKKLKKEKKKEKQRIIMDLFTEPTILNMTNQSFPSQSLLDAVATENFRSGSSITSSSNTLIPPSSTGSITSTVASSLVPKLKLKLGNCQSPTPADDSAAQKLTKIPTVSKSDEREKREPSPELARISPLVTRPPKQKISSGDASTLHTIALNVASTSINTSNSEYLCDNSKANVPSNLVPPTHLSIPPPSPWLSEGTLSASSVLLPQQLLKTTNAHEHQFPSTSTGILHSTDSSASATSVSLVGPTVDRQSPVPLISEANRPSSYIDAEGNRVWICPACGKVDDGSAMIGCDGCDAWYHWICVGIFVAPKDNEDWFCRVCITRKKGIHGTDKKRKRNKKK